MTRRTPLAPALHLDPGVACRGHHGWSSLELATRLDDAPVEVLDDGAYLFLGGLPVEQVVELDVVLAQLEGGREHADAFALDQLLQPPVAVVRRTEVAQRLGPAALT